VPIANQIELRRTQGKAKPRQRGFTMVEIAVVLLVVSILMAFAVPQIRSAVNNYRLRGAVASATWAIQSVRFQSLMEGYPFQVTFTTGNSTTAPSYQIASKPPGSGTFSNVGSSVPLSGQPVALNQNTVLQFTPNGVVTATTGALNNIQFTYQSLTKTITVSNYGNISIQ